jgi:hypothetical protein
VKRATSPSSGDISTKKQRNFQFHSSRLLNAKNRSTPRSRTVRATDSMASVVGAERGQVENGFSGGEQRAKMMLSGMTVLYDVC